MCLDCTKLLSMFTLVMFVVIVFFLISGFLAFYAESKAKSWANGLISKSPANALFFRVDYLSNSLATGNSFYTINWNRTLRILSENV